MLKFRTAFKHPRDYIYIYIYVHTRSVFFQNPKNSRTQDERKTQIISPNPTACTFHQHARHRAYGFRCVTFEVSKIRDFVDFIFSRSRERVPRTPLTFRIVTLSASVRAIFVSNPYCSRSSPSLVVNISDRGFTFDELFESRADTKGMCGHTDDDECSCFTRMTGLSDA